MGLRISKRKIKAFVLHFARFTDCRRAPLVTASWLLRLIAAAISA
jgi:hypothetical protein